MDNPPADRWIVIPNWDKFQHYKDRQPKWIKVYTELGDKPEFRRLSLRRRGILFSLWLLYAASNGQLPASPSYLNRAFGLPTEWEARAWRDHGETMARVGREHGEEPVRRRDLKALEQAEFIQLVASKPLALRARSREGYYVPQEGAGARAPANGRTPAPEEEKTPPPPEDVARVKALVEKVFEK